MSKLVQKNTVTLRWSIPAVFINKLKATRKGEQRQRFTHSDFPADALICYTLKKYTNGQNFLKDFIFNYVSVRGDVSCECRDMERPEEWFQLSWIQSYRQ